MDEIFGDENFISIITFVKISGQTSELISNVADYLIWYGKNKKAIKFRTPYSSKGDAIEGGSEYVWVREPDGRERTLSRYERENFSEASKTGSVFRHGPMVSQGFRQFTTIDYKFQGQNHFPGQSNNWKTTVDGLARLAKADWLVSSGTILKI